MQTKHQGCHLDKDRVLLMPAETTLLPGKPYATVSPTASPPWDALCIFFCLRKQKQKAMSFKQLSLRRLCSRVKGGLPGALLDLQLTARAQQ